MSLFVNIKKEISKIKINVMNYRAKFIVLLFTVFIAMSKAYSQVPDPTDPGIVTLMSPSSVVLGSSGILSADVGNYGTETIVANSLRVTISVGLDAEILGIAPGSDPRWTQLGLLTPGSGNTILLTNSAGGFGASDHGNILLTVKGTTVSPPDIIQSNIVYITAANPLLCDVPNCNPIPLNASQGNASTSNDNHQTSLAVTAAPVGIDAVDDLGTSVNGFTGGTAFTNVLGNDTLNSAPVISAQVNTAFVSSTHAGITLNGTNVMVAANTPAGPHSLVYQICEISNPGNCDTATVSVTVTAPVIDAVDDTSVLPVNGITGGTAFTNVLGNDTLNGASVVPAQVNTTFVSSTNIGITLNGTNVMVAAGTPAGSYSLDYQICEILNPSNCDTATVSVTVCGQIAGPTVSITQPTCSLATGTITVTAPTGAGLTYSINGINYQSGTAFPGLSSNSYNVTVKNSSGCVSDITVAEVNPRPTDCNNGAGIFHTTVSCSDFRNNTGSQIGQLCYTTKSNKVFNVTPGQFFFFASITAPSTDFTIDVVQTNCNGLRLFDINRSSQITLFNANCSKVASGRQVSSGLGRIRITNATEGAQYVLAVKYDSKSIVGSTFAGAAPVCQYTFEAKIDGATVASASINLVPNCSSTTIATTTDIVENKSTEPKMVVTLAPNPSLNDFGLYIKSLSDERITIRIIDIHGRLIRQFKSTPKETIRFGSELAKGLYFIEVTQGDKREVVKAQKL
jgi:hypothetical protein